MSVAIKKSVIKGKWYHNIYFFEYVKILGRIAGTSERIRLLPKNALTAYKSVQDAVPQSCGIGENSQSKTQIFPWSSIATRVDIINASKPIQEPTTKLQLVMIPVASVILQPRT